MTAEVSRDNANAQRRGWDRDRCALALDVRDATDDVGMAECGVARERVVAARDDRFAREADDAVRRQAARGPRQDDVANAQRAALGLRDVQVLARPDGWVHAVTGRVKTRRDSAPEDVCDRALE
jgi:hypothetical protein